jgi:hypothetical protein
MHSVETIISIAATVFGVVGFFASIWRQISVTKEIRKMEIEIRGLKISIDISKPEDVEKIDKIIKAGTANKPVSDL